MQPELKTDRINGARLAWFTSARETTGSDAPPAPTLLFVHATGFHGRIWDRQVEAFPNHDCIAFEQRGHGRSEKLAVKNWATYGRDLSEFTKTLGLSGLIGIAHSMGAHAMIQAASESDAFDRLLLLDPTVAAPDDYAQGQADEWGDELHPAAKRRNRFDSPQAMREQIGGKSSFPLFEPRILNDYCEHGLEPDGDGAYRLCCPPEVEAHVYMSSRSNDAIYDHVAAVDIPVTVVRAKAPKNAGTVDFGASPTWPGLAGRFRQGREHHWDDCSHFIPMERPDAVIALLRDEIDAWSASR
ncbi:MAG: alpha/beta hydrolase [Pseudomonadota bacterium]